MTEEEFDAFLAALKTVEGTWFCDDREDGGATGCKARHPDGVVYLVIHDSVTGHSMTRLPA